MTSNPLEYGDVEGGQLDAAVVAGGEGLDDALLENGLGTVEVDGEGDKESGEEEDSENADPGSDAHPSRTAAFGRRREDRNRSGAPFTSLLSAGGVDRRPLPLVRSGEWGLRWIGFRQNGAAANIPRTSKGILGGHPVFRNRELPAR